jgi:amino acid adenylation domain-containing protein
MSATTSHFSSGGRPVIVHTLVELLYEAAARFGSNIAVSQDHESISYKDLNDWSTAFAALLLSRGLGRGDRVALCLPAGIDAVAAIVGILKSGAAYVPLDSRNPPAWNAFILADSNATAFVGDVGDLEVPDICVIGQEDMARTRNQAKSLPCAITAVSPIDTAYVIYTSGTSGKPKGVEVAHGNVIALLSSASNLFSFTSSDRWTLFHSTAFDFSVWEMWGAIASGAELVVLSYWSVRTPDAYLRIVRDRGVTVLNQTPTAFAGFSAAALRLGCELPDLRYVILGGEKVKPATLRTWADRFGLEKPHLINMYGITETTVHATFHRLTLEDLAGTESVIGRPLPGFSAPILTADHRDADPGEIGELLLAGPQVTNGYLNKPELTAERFVYLPGHEGIPYYRSGDLVSRRNTGDLVYHGRSDHQVKLRGHRIEIAEVEAAVRSHFGITDTVAWVKEYQDDDNRLICAYTCDSALSQPDIHSLREHVKALLPSYMRPAHYIFLREMPLTVNGKIDTDGIARHFEERRTIDASPSRLPAVSGRDYHEDSILGRRYP